MVGPHQSVELQRLDANDVPPTSEELVSPEHGSVDLRHARNDGHRGKVAVGDGSCVAASWSEVNGYDGSR
jgi:hypothetical protein